MAVDYTIIGSRLKDARLRSHINLKRLSQFCTILGVSEGYILSGTSDANDTYLANEFSNLLKKCSPERQKLIYKVSKAIAESDD